MTTASTVLLPQYLTCLDLIGYIDGRDKIPINLFDDNHYPFVIEDIWFETISYICYTPSGRRASSSFC